MGKQEKRGIRNIVFFKLNLYSILSILGGILIDMGGHYLVEMLNPPLWLDLVGTMMVAIQFGPIAGAFTGTVSVFTVHLISGGQVVYCAVGAAVGILVGFLFPRKNPNDLFMIITVGLFAGLLSSAISLPFNLLYYNGETGSRWGDALEAMLDRHVANPKVTNFLASAFLDLPDKVLSIFLASLLMNLEQLIFLKKRRHGKKNKEKKSKNAAGLSAILILALGLSLIPGGRCEAADYESDYEAMIYGTKEGLASAESNAVAQTKNGYIWIGTYSGLYVYDGVKFEEADIDSMISNVTFLYVDSKGMLWIATNDSGVYVFDTETYEYKGYTSYDGLASDSVRTICEDREGNIYIGTSLALSKIDRDGMISSFTDWKDFYYTESLACLPDGSMVGVSTSGVFYRLRDDKILDSITFGREDGVFYRNVTIHDEEILVGTSADIIDRYRTEGDKLQYQNYIRIQNASYINEISYDENEGGIFVCCENGMGFVDNATNRYFDMSRDDFGGAIEDVCVDYQGNIWFVSSKQGLIKFSRTSFRNLFFKANIESDVTNATMVSDDRLYIGTDSGLRVIDLKNMTQVGTPYMAELESMRIRNIMKDSKGNLWFSTYSEHGLICVDPSYHLTFFNEKSNGFLGMQCRTTIELSDGRILAASKNGLTFIKDGEVVKTIGQKDGLDNSMILCMMEREDGSILAASDGDGIYIIEDDKVSGHIDEKQGLWTSVVMRIVKCQGGYLYVTSNALYYDDGNEVRRLVNFPYSNNYDVLITDDDYCWITSSAGLFKVDQKQLLQDESYNYILLNSDWGLGTKFTANSWTAVKDGVFYLCCTDGVRRLAADDATALGGDYELQLKYVENGNARILEKDGTFTIPASNGRVNFHIAVNNNALSNPLIHYYLEGSNDEGIICAQNEVMPLSFTDLPAGDYMMHIEVLAADGSVEKSKVVPVTKKAMMYERLYFKVYLGFVLFCLAFYFCWLFLTIHKKTSSIIGLQKEISTDPMTGLLNKAGAHKTLTKVCAEDTGVLMMIDLDSFKLVNDLYGHDMGDRILIRFSELIREALDANDVSGRIGGDEFIGFMKNVMDEEDVDRVTRFLNREMMKSAKEYMGEDMNIPLGVSIGAVRVPVEGREFGELSKLADKALYVVKQNGKHGYSFYQKKREVVDLDDEERDNNSFEQIKQIIGERNLGKGAYLVNFDKLQVIYKFMNRFDREMESTTGFFRFRLEGDAVTDELRDELEEFLIVNLRKNDVISRYSGSFYVLCVGRKEGAFEDIAGRLSALWEEEHPDKAKLVYEIEHVGTEEMKGEK